MYRQNKFNLNLPEKNIIDIPIHFIFCTERTGSSMLATMLNISDEVLCASEELFTLYFSRKYEHKSKWTINDIIKFTDDFFLLLENSPDLYFTNKETLLNTLILHRENLNFQLLIRLIYMHFIDVKNKGKVKVIIDKQIKFLFHLKKVKSIFPHAKIILLTRDIRSNAFSKSKRKINGKENLIFHAGTWNETYKNFGELIQLYPNQTLLVKYEDLVLQPENTLQRVCNFIKVSYDPKMLNFKEYFKEFLSIKNNKNTEQKISSIKSFHESTLSELDQNKIDSWRSNLKKKTAMKISTIGYETGLKLGYNFNEPYGLTQLEAEDLKYLSQSKRLTTQLFNFYLSMPLKLKILIKRCKCKLNFTD